MTAIQKDQSKIDNQISDYKTAIDKVNTLLQAFKDAGFKIDDKQANEFCQRNFNDDSLRAYALTISSTTSPTQQEKEVRDITSNLKEIILSAIPGWNLDFHSMVEVKVKNSEAKEDPKVIKAIEERYTVLADGKALEVFSQLQTIAEQINVVFPQLKKSVFNRRLDFRHLFKEDANGKVIPNLDFVDFSDL
ncbi:MAG: hypothetical protein LC112_10725 [Flavobacteriales bacterium]|nr:hypothetical protein [Flavobacteriales bacterium]